MEKVPYLEPRLGRLERRPTGLDTLDSETRRSIEQALGRPLPGHTLVEKGVDVRLAVDMVEMARKDIYDVAILITGDGDFSPAVNATKDIGKYVELAHVEGQPCRDLQKCCDREWLLDADFMQECWLPRGGPRP